MVRPMNVLKELYGVDFEKEPFISALEKLEKRGLTSFRLNLRPDVTVCAVFTKEGGKALNDALDGYLEKLENSV